MENYQICHTAIENIKKVLKEDTYGWKNTQSINKIKAAIFIIKNELSDPYVREKAGSIGVWTDILFSEKKHKKYTGGTEQIKGFILADCAGLSSRLETLQNGTE